MNREHTLYMEQYAYASRLRHGSAFLKTVFSVSVVLLCVGLDSQAVSLFVILTMAAVTVGIGGIKMIDYVRILTIALFFILFGAAALVFATHDTGKVVEVTLRAVGAVSAFYFLVLSTPVSEILTVLRRCRLPKLLVELMYLTYRFIFVLTDVWHSLYTAAQSRLGYVDYRTSLRTFGDIAGNLLVLSMRKADVYYTAMEARCYDGDLRFLEETKRCRLWQCAVAALYICVLVLVRRIAG